MYSKVDHGITVGGKGCILVGEKSKYVQFPNRLQSLCTMHASGTCKKPFFRDAHLNTKYWPMFHAETKNLPLVYNTNLL